MKLPQLSHRDLFWLVLVVLACGHLRADEKAIPFPELPEGAGKIDANAPKQFTKTESGLQYRILRQSTGKKPILSDDVVVHYVLWIDGETLLSTYDGEPMRLPVTKVVKGFAEGIRLIGEGGMIELIVPPKLGWGDKGGSGVPPKATQHYVVELSKIEETDLIKKRK